MRTAFKRFWVTVGVVAAYSVLAFPCVIFLGVRDVIWADFAMYVLVFSAPVVFLVFWRRYLRTERSSEDGIESVSCETCGYDLTGNVSEWCPECGAEVEAGHPPGHCQG